MLSLIDHALIPAPKEQQRVTRKEAILQVATLLFSQKGYKETSIADLSKLTGVAEGTIFYHFKNKETLFISVLERTRTLILEEFDDFVRDRISNTGMELLENSVYFYLYLAGKLDNQLLLLHRHYPYQIALENLVCRDHLEAIYECLVDIFERAVRLGQKDGSIDNLPPRKIALIIFSMIDGIVRLKTYNLYDAGALTKELMIACRRILTAEIPHNP
jgi:AcrR family transcriptional regulator